MTTPHGEWLRIPIELGWIGAALAVAAAVTLVLLVSQRPGPLAPPITPGSLGSLDDATDEGIALALDLETVEDPRGDRDLAEIVGKWIWITFPEPPAEKIRGQLSHFGFHWNNHRECWQHPCGQFATEGSGTDPRAKYGSHPATELKAA